MRCCAAGTVDQRLYMPSILSSIRLHPLLAMFQIAASLAAFPAFFCVVYFLAAISPEQAAKSGRPLPPGWGAGVMNHGKYSHWWLIADRPVLFSFALVSLACCLTFLWWSVLSRRQRA